MIIRSYPTWPGGFRNHQQSTMGTPVNQPFQRRTCGFSPLDGSNELHKAHGCLLNWCWVTISEMAQQSQSCWHLLLMEAISRHGSCLVKPPPRRYRTGAWLRAFASCGNAGMSIVVCDIFYNEHPPMQSTMTQPRTIWDALCTAGT